MSSGGSQISTMRSGVSGDAESNARGRLIAGKTPAPASTGRGHDRLAEGVDMPDSTHIARCVTCGHRMYHAGSCDICDENREEAHRAETVDQIVALVLSLHYFEHEGGDLPFDGVLREVQDRVCATVGYRTPAVIRNHRKRKIASSLRRQVLERDMYRCRYCGTHIDLSLHHVLPESRGGEETLENLVTACTPCNSRIGTNVVFPPEFGGGA